MELFNDDIVPGTPSADITVTPLAPLGLTSSGPIVVDQKNTATTPASWVPLYASSNGLPWIVIPTGPVIRLRAIDATVYAMLHS